MRESEAAARSLGIDPRPMPVRGADEFEEAFSAMARARAGALVTVGSTLFADSRRRIVGLAAEYRLPAVYPI